MIFTQRNLLTIIMMILATIVFACNGSTNGEHAEGELNEEGSEESDIQYALNDTCNEVYNGVRLIMYYDSQNKSFTGSIENTTETMLNQVRVEVHLSNGVELGPTTPADLGSSEVRPVVLNVKDQNFEKWSAHPEVGTSEHGGKHGESEGHGEEHRSEDREHR